MLEILSTVRKYVRDTPVIKCVLMCSKEKHMHEEEYRFRYVHIKNPTTESSEALVLIINEPWFFQSSMLTSS